MAKFNVDEVTLVTVTAEVEYILTVSIDGLVTMAKFNNDAGILIVDIITHIETVMVDIANITDKVATNIVDN
jgi:hypothetical protein